MTAQDLSELVHAVRYRQLGEGCAVLRSRLQTESARRIAEALVSGADVPPELVADVERVERLAGDCALRPAGDCEPR